MKTTKAGFLAYSYTGWPSRLATTVAMWTGTRYMEITAAGTAPVLHRIPFYDYSPEGKTVTPLSGAKIYFSFG